MLAQALRTRRCLLLALGAVALPLPAVSQDMNGIIGQALQGLQGGNPAADEARRRDEELRRERDAPRRDDRRRGVSERERRLDERQRDLAEEQRRLDEERRRLEDARRRR